MSPRRPERHRRWHRWLVPGALVALAPKCVLCVLGYLGLGAMLGLGGPEICGATTGTTVLRTGGFVAAGVALAAVVFLVLARRHLRSFGARNGA